MHKKTLLQYLALLLAMAMLMSLFSGCGGSGANDREEPEPREEAEAAQTARAEELLSEVIESDDFADADLEERRDLVEEILDECYEEGLIQEEAEYDKSTKLYTFTYADDTLGGVSLEEFENTRRLDPGTLDLPQGVALSRSDWNVLILNGFEDTPFRREYYTELESLWDSIGVETTVDTTVTVKDMKQLDDANVVIFAMHGSTYLDFPVLCLNETVTDRTDEAYEKHLRREQSVAKVFCTDYAYHYWVFPSFFQKCYGSDDLDGMIFFSESCCFFGCDCISEKPDDAFAQALIGCSADTVFGYHNSVMAKYSRNVMSVTLGNLFYGEAAHAALARAMAMYGTDDQEEDIREDKYLAYPMVYEDQQLNPAMFRDTYWLLTRGQTLGTQYYAHFLGDGTCETFCLGSGELACEQYEIRDSQLILKGVAYEADPAGFRSVEKFPMQAGEDHYWLYPSEEDLSEYFAVSDVPTAGTIATELCGMWHHYGKDEEGYFIKSLILNEDGSAYTGMGWPYSEYATMYAGTWEVLDYAEATYVLALELEGGFIDGDSKHHSLEILLTWDRDQIMLYPLSGEDLLGIAYEQWYGYELDFNDWLAKQ